MASETARRKKALVPQATRTRLTGEERREQLIRSARKVFTQSGEGGATVTDIAREAGVTEALLYRYFENKDQLFEAAVIEPLESLIQDMAAQSELFTLVDGRTRLALATQIHTGLCAAMTEMGPMLVVALFSDRTRGERLWKERVLPLLDRAADAAGEMRKGWEHSPIDPRLQFLAMLGMHLVVALDANFQNEPLDCELVGNELATLMARGVSVPKKRAPRED